jgi:hypothetical protein
MQPYNPLYTKKTTSGRMLGMCYILCVRRGFPEGRIPLVWGFGGNAPEFVFSIFYVCFSMVFQHMVFVDGFLILVKELGFLTNSIQWIRGFGCRRSYILHCFTNN